MAGGESDFLDKGKESWFKKSRPRPAQPTCNVGVKIRKKRSFGSKMGGFDSESDSSESKSDIRFNSNFRLIQDNCSKAGQGRSKSVSGLKGSLDVRPEVGGLLIGKQGLSEVQMVNKALVTEVNSLDIVVDWRNQGSIVSCVSESNAKEETDKSIQSDEVQANGGRKSQKRKKAANYRGKHIDSSFKTHPMITRGVKSHSVFNSNKVKKKMVIWNIAEEITNFFEKGVAMGVDLKNRGSSLDDKVSRIMETGAALGFDFNCNEDEIAEFVSSREKEDEARKLA
ncbi:hypothetical protein Q3G72_029415 [Acer saccharum]|nr:hypothetical protein Q3G72_029415 [Acer saccharum]